MGGRTAGFTLVEIILATALVALVVYFVVSLIPTANQSLRQAQDIESATVYGQQQVESLRAAIAKHQKVAPADSGTVLLNGTNFNVLSEASVVQANGPWSLYEIAVTLSRTDGKLTPLQFVNRVAVHQ